MSKSTRKSSSKKKSASRKNKASSSSRKKSETETSENELPDLNLSEENVSEKADKSETASDKKANSDANSESENEDLLQNKRIRMALKKKIIAWLDYDDRIREVTKSLKEYKDRKKNEERDIITAINKLKINNDMIDIQNKDGTLRCRVQRVKSTTKSSIKEDTIEEALKEIFPNSDRKVKEICRKIISKREINERFYLKRQQKKG